MLPTTPSVSLVENFKFFYTQGLLSGTLPSGKKRAQGLFL